MSGLRIFLGSVAGFVVGAMIVGTTILRAYLRAAVLQPTAAGSPLVLAPHLFAFVLAGGLAGAATAAPSIWARYPAVAAVLAAAAGWFLTASAPFVHPFPTSGRTPLDVEPDAAQLTRPFSACATLAAV
jgi:hypothetical protein